jgi:glutamate-1-semialdehyde 2,1-aminomutase
VRAYTAVGGDPVVVSEAAGSRIRDIDGLEYIDYVCSWGPLILGHAHPAVLDAVRDAAERGWTYGAPCEAEVELAEEVRRRFGSVEMLRMVNSGTEASMSAVRLARAATGRELVVKFAGAYHGHVDGLLAEAGSGLATQGIPASPGVTTAQAAEVIVVPWNDREAVAAAVAQHPVAAILAEPVAANMGVVPPGGGFLEFLREQADLGGAVLVLDEVISGFRVARGGAQDVYGVDADLTIMGKVLGGGLPAAAYGGRRELMEQVAPVGDVYQAGTLSGNPVVVEAGLATLRELDPAAYERLAALTESLAAALRDAAGNGPVQVVSVCGLVTPFFSAEPVHDFAGAAACDLEAYGRFCRALLDRGIYPPASQFEAWFVSLAHDEAAIAKTATAASEAFAEALR